MQEGDTGEEVKKRLDKILSFYYHNKRGEPICLDGLRLNVFVAAKFGLKGLLIPLLALNVKTPSGMKSVKIISPWRLRVETRTPQKDQRRIRSGNERHDLQPRFFKIDQCGQSFLSSPKSPML
jgi:hypothetical protein